MAGSGLVPVTELVNAGRMNEAIVGVQLRLAECYEKGQGVPKDMDEAIRWYRKAAEQGNKDAEKRLEVLEF